MNQEAIPHTTLAIGQHVTADTVLDGVLEGIVVELFETQAKLRLDKPLQRRGEKDIRTTLTVPYERLRGYGSDTIVIKQPSSTTTSAAPPATWECGRCKLVVAIPAGSNKQKTASHHMQAECPYRNHGGGRVARDGSAAQHPPQPRPPVASPLQRPGEPATALRECKRCHQGVTVPYRATARELQSIMRNHTKRDCPAYASSRTARRPQTASATTTTTTPHEQKEITRMAEERDSETERRGAPRLTPIDTTEWPAGELHPLLYGLIQELPAPGAWPHEKQKRWLAAQDAIFRLLFPEPVEDLHMNIG